MTQLSVTPHRRGGTMHLCVASDVDLATSTTLGHAITTPVTTRTPTNGALVDLVAVTFIECTGVTALLTDRRLAAARLVSYQAVNANGIALRVLQTLDLVALTEQCNTRRRRPASCVAAGASDCPKGVGVRPGGGGSWRFGDDHITGCGNRM